ncbi:MAG: hypothetical protein P4L87_23680, partial [Formivibrio sp.]|nr:hypothetical protein [Formivibrio sp.]
QPNQLRYQVNATTDNHVFYASAGGTAATELARITGTGKMSCAGTLTAGGAATMNGGLTVASGRFGVSGAYLAPTTQGVYMGWNRAGSSGTTSFMNQQGGGTGGFEWLNYNNSNVLSPSTPGMTLDSLSNITLPGATTIIGGTSVAVPTSTTSSNCIQFLQLASPNGGYTIEMNVCVSSTSFSESVMYRIPMQFDAAAGLWLTLRPDKYNAAFGSFRIDMTANGGTAAFRLVRVNGTVPGTAMISFKVTGSVTYILQSAVSTDTSVPAVYNNGSRNPVFWTGWFVDTQSLTGVATTSYTSFTFPSTLQSGMAGNTNWGFTAPISGFYEADWSLWVVSDKSILFGVFVGSTMVSPEYGAAANVGSSYTYVHAGSFIFYAAAGSGVFMGWKAGSKAAINCADNGSGAPVGRNGSMVKFKLMG